VTVPRRPITRAALPWLASWLPAVAWTMVVLSFSSGEWSAAQTGQLLMPVFGSIFWWATPDQLVLIHGVTRKAAHVTEYAILAALWFRAIRRTTARPGVAASLSLLTSVACAIVDEVHQASVPSRTGSPIDVGIDATAALAACVLLHVWTRGRGALPGRREPASSHVVSPRRDATSLHVVPPRASGDRRRRAQRRAPHVRGNLRTRGPTPG
jgi:VanZ family protein